MFSLPVIISNRVGVLRYPKATAATEILRYHFLSPPTNLSESNCVGLYLVLMEQLYICELCVVTSFCSPLCDL